MELLKKNHANNFTKKPVKVPHGHTSSMQLSSFNQHIALHNQAFNPQSSNNARAKTDDQPHQNTEVTKIQPRKIRISISVTPERGSTIKKPAAVSLSTENLSTLLNSGMRKHHVNVDRKQADSQQLITTRSGNGPTDIRNNRQLIYRELNQSLNQKDLSVPKSHPKQLNETHIPNSSRFPHDIKLPRIDIDKHTEHVMIQGDQINESTKKDATDEKSKQKRGPLTKAKSLGHNEFQTVLTKKAVGMMNSPSLFKEPKIKRESINPHQVLAKRGKVVGVPAIKSSAMNQFASSKPSGSLNEIKDEVEEVSITGSENSIVSGFSYKSKAGALPDKPVKTNQDAFIVNPKFSDNPNYHLFAVCDGHGLKGHDVSAFLKQNLPRNLEYQLKKCKFEESKLRAAITQGFLQTRKELMDSGFEVDHSGSTAVSVLLLNNRIFSANVGDSRAIMGKLVNGVWKAVPLSNDHKPDDPNEMKRIISCGGRVEPYKEFDGKFIGPPRVWLKYCDIPGLAMTRSFGDALAGAVGVISEPEIMDRYYEEDDKFIVLASDGIWDFMPNEEVVNFIAPYYQKGLLDAACQNLIREATNRWKQEDEVVDDITCIIVGLKAPTKANQTNH